MELPSFHIRCTALNGLADAVRSASLRPASMTPGCAGQVPGQAVEHSLVPSWRRARPRALTWASVLSLKAAGMRPFVVDP